MQVATMPKGNIVSKGGMMSGQQILQTSGGKAGIPQGATIVKLVNAQGGAAGQKIVMKQGPGGGLVHANKPQTIVINKQGGLKTAQGQQIIVVSSGQGGGIKTVTTPQSMIQAGIGGTTTSSVVQGSLVSASTASSVPSQGQQVQINEPYPEIHSETLTLPPDVAFILSF